MWEKDRVEELRELRTLVYILSGINNGSDFIGNVNSCIEIAKKLDKSDLREPRIGFVEFLTNTAYNKGDQL